MHPSSTSGACWVVRAQHIIRCSVLRCLHKENWAPAALSLSDIPFLTPSDWCACKKVGTVFSITGLWKLHSPSGNQTQMPIVMDSFTWRGPGQTEHIYKSEFTSQVSLINAHFPIQKSLLYFLSSCWNWMPLFRKLSSWLGHLFRASGWKHVVEMSHRGLIPKLLLKQNFQLIFN